MPWRRAKLCGQMLTVHLYCHFKDHELFQYVQNYEGLAANIYIVVDSSWSIGEDNTKHVRQFLFSLTQAHHHARGDGFEFALVQYNNKPHTEFQHNTYPTMAGVLAHIKSMPYHGGGTQTGLCLDSLTRVHLNASSGGRAFEGAVQVVVVLEYRCSQDDVAVPAQVLQLAGMELFTVGVQDAVDSELREMASQPDDTHVFSVGSFLTLWDIIQDLVVGICQAVTQSGGDPVAVKAPVTQRGTGKKMGPTSLPY